MAVDIHWVFERKNNSGSWEAVFSDVRLQEIRQPGDKNSPAFNSAEELARRNYPWFSRLSGAALKSDEPPIVPPGLPDDCSAYTAGFLDGDLRVIRGYRTLRPLPMCHHGMLTFSEIASGAAETEDGMNPALLVSGNAPQSHYLRRLKALVEQLQPLLHQEILFGDTRLDPFPEHPGMENASNHQRLESLSRLEDLLPVRGDTLRWVIAYEK